MQNWNESELIEFAQACAFPVGAPLDDHTSLSLTLDTLPQAEVAKALALLNELYQETVRGRLMAAVTVARSYLHICGFVASVDRLAVISASHFGLWYRQRERTLLTLIERDIEFATSATLSEYPNERNVRIAVRPVTGGGRQIVRESIDDDRACVLDILSVDDADRLRQTGIKMAINGRMMHPNQRYAVEQ